MPRADCQAGPRYTGSVTKRDPHDVLGVPVGAGTVAIRSAWRRLARANHPDLTADDPKAVQLATTRMAEINAAYEILRRAIAAGRPLGEGSEPGSSRAEASGTGGRRGGPPRPKPTRPVTGRLDTTDTFRTRNATSGPGVTLPGHPPRRADRIDSEAPRASDPNGPLERARVRRFRAPPRPSLADARAFEISFGKFHGHRLGDIAAFEPSYIDWIARTIQRDPDLASAARVVRDDLDARSVVRRVRHDVRPRRASA